MIHYVGDATTIEKKAHPELFRSNTSSANVGLQKCFKSSTETAFDIQQIQGAENSLTNDVVKLYLQYTQKSIDSYHHGTWSLYTQIQHIDERISEMFECLQQIRSELSQRPLASTSILYDLGSDIVKVQLPISIVIHESDEESIVRWPETRSYGIGNTLAEAIAILKENIIDLFEDLNSRNFESLGNPAIDTLRILNTHLRIDK